MVFSFDMVKSQKFKIIKYLKIEWRSNIILDISLIQIKKDFTKPTNAQKMIIHTLACFNIHKNNFH